VKALIVNLVVLAVATVVAVLLGEVMVRTVAPQQLYRFPDGLYVSHPLQRYRLAPAFEGVAETSEYDTTIRTNGIGLREDAEIGPKQPGTYRILAIGDSFTMGVGVNGPETFVELLEDRLNEASFGGMKYEVINAGVPGFNINQEIITLDERGRELMPDLVVLGIFVGNDISDSLNSGEVLVVNGTLRAAGEQGGLLPPAVRYWLQRSSHLYRLVWPLQRRLLDRNFDARARASELRRLSIYSTQVDGPAADLWQGTEEQLDRFVRTAVSLGIRPAVITIPESMQVVAPAWDATVERLQLSRDVYAHDYPNRRIADFLGRRGVPVLDLIDVFATTESDTPHYFAMDGHWTVSGNQLAAQRIYDFLVEDVLREPGVGASDSDAIDAR